MLTITNARIRLKYVLLLYILVVASRVSIAQTPITSATFNNVTTGLTTSSYVATSPSDASGGITASTSYTVSYGQTQNQFITDYTVGGNTFNNFVLPDTLIIRRTDAGRQLIIFYEYNSIDTGPDPDEIILNPEQQGEEDILYQSGLSNVGYDNILTNSATNFANVERIDIIYFSGVVTSSPSTAVFPIVERGGNDDIRVAAISSLDSNGDPDGYYPTVVRISNDGTTDWGNLGQTHVSLVMRRQDAISNPIPVQVLGTQNINGSAVAFDEFGVTANDIVYGYSIFADDVTVTGSDLVDFTNSTNYPTGTTVSGLDLIAGISTAVASDNNLRKSTGPGGYKGALSTWLKANVGVTTATDASTVTLWEDQFLAENDATTLTSAPTFRDGTASGAEDINFNPTIDFLDATERGLQIANNLEFNTGTSYTKKAINLAFRTGNDITVKQQVYEQGDNDRGLNVYVRAGSLYVGGWNIPTTDGTGDDWGFSSTSTSSIATETEYIVTLELDGDTGGSGTIRAYLNGELFGTISSVGILFGDASSPEEIGVGDTHNESRYDDGTTAAASFYGSISEIIYCNEPTGFTGRANIESYLAIKYGITLDQSTAINYTNSAGDIIFNTTNNAALGGYLEYNNDIAGVGRDDNSEFEQLSSQSENTGSLVQVDRNSSIGTDDTWLIWGNDGGATTSSRIVTKPETINERLERVWRVAEENSVGVTDISFDLTGLGFGTDPNDFSLMIAGSSSAADFSSATLLTGGTFNGDVITFTNVDLTDGQYFTLGTQFFVCTPGNVQDGLSLWLRADAEAYSDDVETAATNGDDVVYWGDQSRNNFDAQDDTNRSPTWIATDVNFNPGLNFPDDGGSNAIGFNLGSNYIFAEDADGGTHIFAAIEPIDAGTNNNTRQQKMIYSFGDRNTAQIGLGSSHIRGTIQTPGDNNNFTIAPNASEFIVEGDYDIGAGTDNHYFNIDGERVRSESRNYQLNDAVITQASTHSTDSGPVSIGRLSESNTINSNDGRRYYGDIQEVIVYNEEITDLQAQQVRSYLAIKYGTTLTDDNDGDATPNETLGGSVVEGDYVASDGTTITFDYSDDTGFVTNVAGIGRDDDTCLEQKQSRSVNTGTILTIGLGEIAVNNAANANTFDDDLDFLTWGSDGASTDFANITTAGTPGTVTDRMLRIWRAQDTGDVGATDISFDLSSLPGYSATAGDYQLIIASGGDNTSLENGTTVTGGTFNGSVLTFSGVNLTDGQYFTLGVASDLCGPGGVTGSMVLWLRPDQGTSTTTDNTTISTWTDQSNASNDATTDGNPPLFRDNSSDNINFQPTVSFDGADDRLTLGDLAEIKSVTGTGDYSMFSVGLRDDGSTNYVLGSTGGTTNQDLHFGYRNSTQAAIAHWANDLNVTVNAFDSPNVPYLIGAVYDGSNRAVEENRDDNFSRASELETVDISGTQTNYVGDLESVGNYDGFISEVLVYNGAVTDLEKLRIYSYFAIKYGITLPQDNDNDATLNETISGSVQEGDLVASDGTTIIWDESNSNATYHNGMAGIGRDDASCLNQKQSTSASDGTILTIGLDAVATDNAANTGIHDDQDFLVWGHDDGATAQASAETVDVPSTVSERMTRVWRVEDTGTVGATEIEFDLTGLGYGTDASDFRLIIADNASGGTMSGGTLTAGGTFNGSVLSFSGVDLTDGQYFTLGTALTTCGPGGVNTNIGIWLRADIEVFSDAGSTAAVDGDDALQWNDQSSPAANASEADGGGGSPIEPVFETDEANAINFNPVVFISDQNTTNNSFFETAAASNTIDGDMTLIAIFETAQNQGSDNNFENTPSLIGAGIDGTSDGYGLGIYQGEVIVNAANNDDFTARSTTTYNDGEPYMATATRDQGGSFDVNLYVNSLLVDNGTSDATALDAADTWAIGNQSGYINGGQLQGNVAEVLVFSSVLSGEELARVESYLALKYGITRTDDNDDDATTNEIISGSIREGDYVAGDAGIIWDYAARGATFFNDIAGIGRDDLSCFDQTHSKSENDDAIVDIEIDSWANDDSWHIWGNDGASIEATRNTERPATIQSRLNREWQVQETGTVGTVSVTFDLTDVTGTPTGDNNLTQVRMMVSTDDDFSTGVTLVEPTSTDGLTVTFDYDFTALEGFYYTLGSFEQDALPIELLSFSVNEKDESVELKWTTASEENNAFYSIERSKNGIDFENIAQIDGAGTTQGLNHYQFIDNSPLSGFSYYRLKQTDVSGEFSYSSIESIFMKSAEELKLSIMPNPVRGGDEVKLKIDFPGDITSAVMSVFDRQGNVLFQSPLTIENALHNYDTSSLKSGIYFIRIQVNNHKAITKRLIIR